MHPLTNIAELQKRIDTDELLQIAGVGSFNTPQGRSLNEERINEAIGAASETIRSYVAKRYPLINDLTAETTPAMVQKVAADLVRHDLRSRTGDRNTVTEETQRRHDQAMAWLKDVSRGLANVDLLSVGDGGAAATADAATHPTGNVLMSSPPARVDDTLKGYA